ncbi:hypothetical protein [Cyclobacterium roseum]|uniref:hypothetical protein n=1 Tax=Cyclobacterium roseum TaxID=2666137 RepID=UPI001391E123|nr:hypothetical protein [Cyclobacterium roseum]
MEKDVFRKIAQYRDLKESSAFTHVVSEGDTNEIILKKDENRTQLENLKSAIMSELDKKGIDKVRKNLVHALNKLLGVFDRSNTGFPLDRKQGMGIENYIYGKVYGVIRSAMKNGYSYYFPEFYQRVESDFDLLALHQLLLSFKNELETTNFKDFFELEACVETYLSRIKQLWEKENEAMVIHRH